MPGGRVQVAIGGLRCGARTREGSRPLIATEWVTVEKSIGMATAIGGSGTGAPCARHPTPNLHCSPSIGWLPRVEPGCVACVDGPSLIIVIIIGQSGGQGVREAAANGRAASSNIAAATNPKLNRQIATPASDAPGK